MADAEQPRTDTTVEVDGNRLTLLTDGPERLDALLGLIDGARRSVRLLYYTYRDDRAGDLVYAAYPS